MRWESLKYARQPQITVEKYKSLEHSSNLRPFRVLGRDNTAFKLQLRNKIDTVSIDRLKTAYIDPPEVKSGLCETLNVSADQDLGIGQPPTPQITQGSRDGNANPAASQHRF